MNTNWQLYQTLTEENEYAPIYFRERYKQRLAGAFLQRRLQLGMSQQTLADAVGCSRSQISHIENGEGNPSLLTLSRIAEALGAVLDDPNLVPIETQIKKMCPASDRTISDDQVENAHHHYAVGFDSFDPLCNDLFKLAKYSDGVPA